MIHVTKTFLPNKEKYQSYVDKIFEAGWITNNGPMVKELEKRLATFLGVKNIVLVSNGTVALEIAYRTLELKGFVITTPFSFVATTSSLVTNGLLPIFCDINSKTLNMDYKKIETLITPNTSAILPVHVFGNACDVEEIQEIANKHNLKVIYDAAHAFGVTYKDKNVLNYGDISTLSFHATKLFHTIEGGALIINDDELVQKARFLINFGIDGVESVKELGTNAKMNEFQAAMGLAVLDEIEAVQNKRKEDFEYYEKYLKNLVDFQLLNVNSKHNYSYCPILLENERKVLEIKEALAKSNIFPRRYFYPSLDTLPYIEPKQYCEISRDISTRILCLPMSYELLQSEQDTIISIIKECLK